MGRRKRRRTRLLGAWAGGVDPSPAAHLAAAPSGNYWRCLAAK